MADEATVRSHIIIYEHYLLSVDACARQNDLPELKYHWFSCDSWRPEGRRHACLQTFPSLASPSPCAPYFSHSFAVSFPPRSVLETPAKEGIRYQVSGPLKLVAQWANKTYQRGHFS